MKIHKLVPLVCAVLSPLAARAVTVGYAEAKAVSSYPQSTMDAIAQSNWYFAHASVGGNMMHGVALLHADQPTFYRLVADDAHGGTPPVTTVPGRIYGNYRGNPWWTDKISWFESFVGAGWRAPKVTFVANKFCWIDQEADLQAYLDSMTSLEAANPGTRFVYMTMPVTVEEDANNTKRNVFNDDLRAWAQANNKLLFDVASIESHAPDGTPQTYTDNGRTGQKFYSGYQVGEWDVGHLNDPGSKAVALGFYAIAASQLGPSSGSDVPLLPPAGLAVLAFAFAAGGAWYLHTQRSATAA